MRWRRVEADEEGGWKRKEAIRRENMRMLQAIQRRAAACENELPDIDPTLFSGLIERGGGQKVVAEEPTEDDSDMESLLGGHAVTMSPTAVQVSAQEEQYIRMVYESQQRAEAASPNPPRVIALAGYGLQLPGAGTPMKPTHQRMRGSGRTGGRGVGGWGWATIPAMKTMVAAMEAKAASSATTPAL